MTRDVECAVYRIVLVVILAIFTLSACGSSGGTSTDDAVATKVQEALAATRESESLLQTAIAAALTATATNAPTTTLPPTITPIPTGEPTEAATATPTESLPTLTPSPPPPEPTATPTEVPAADQYAARGYVPFNRPEIDMMIHPALSFDTEDSTSDGDIALYRFADFNAQYLVFDIRVYKELSGGGRISHELAHSEPV